MNYSETIELEENIKIKKRADDIYNKFLNNISLSVKQYKGDNRFRIWGDNHNDIYIELNSDDSFTFVCAFLHENYSIKVTPESIFDAIKTGCRGLEHLESHVTHIRN